MADQISILIKSLLTAPSDADIKKLKEDLEKKLGNVKVNTKGNGIKLLNQEEIDIYIKKLQNSLDRTKFKTPKVFDSESVKQEINKLNDAFSKLKSGELSTKQVGLQFDNLKTKITEVSSGLKNTSKDGYSFAQMIELAGKKIAVWGISTALVYGSFRQLKEGISYIADLDNSLNQIRIVTGQSQEQVEKLAVSYNNLAKSMSVSTKEVASTAVDLYRQGLQGTDVEDRMQAIIKYAKISSLSLADSNKIITATMNATGESAQKVIDIFSYLGDATSSGADEIGTAMQKVASMSDGIGVSFEKAASWIAVISSKTREGSAQIGTSLKSIESRYSSIKAKGFNSEDATSINDVTKALTQAGIQATTSDGQLRNFAEVIDELGQKYQGLDKKTQNYVMTTLGGTYQMNRLRALMDGYSQSIDLYNNSLSQAGIANQKFNIWQESTAAKMDKLKASWEGFWQSSVDSGLIKGTLDVANSLVSTLGNLPTVITTIVTAIALWKGTQITSWLTSSKVASEGWRVSLIANRGAVIGLTEAEIAAKTATTGWALSWNALKVAFLSNPIGAIATAVLAVVTAIDIFNQKQEEAKQKAGEQAQQLNQESNALNDLKQQYVDIAKSGNLTSESKTRLKSIQDQLIKTYGLEASQLDLVNGKYKDQITLIDESIAKKAKEQLALLGTSNIEASNKLNNRQELLIGSGKNLSSEAYNLSEKYNNLQIGVGNSDILLTGDLKEKTETLRDYISELTKVENPTENVKKLINELSGEYEKLNKEFTDNSSILEKYTQNKNVVDFYDDFKGKISEVNNLFDESNKNPNDNGLQKQLEELKNQMIQVAESKGRLADFKPFIEELFSKPSTSNDIPNTINSQIKSFEDLSKEVKTTVNSIKELNNIQADLSKGNKLSADSIIDLITQYPELINYLKQTKDGYIIEAQGMEIVKKALIEKQITALETESGITDIMKQQLQERLDLYGIELDSIKTLNDARFTASQMFANVPDIVKQNTGFQQYQKSVETQLESIAKLNTLKDLLNSGLKTGVKQPKTKDISDKSFISQNETLIEKDRYYELNQELNKTNNLIEKNKALQETSDLKKRVQLMKEEQELLVKKQQNLSNIATENRKEREEIKSYLSSVGIRFAGNGDDASAINAKNVLDKKLAELNSHRNDKDKTVYNKIKSQYDEMLKSYQRFIEIQVNDIPKAQIEWAQLTGEINKTGESINKIADDKKTNALSLSKDFIDAQKKISEAELEQQQKKLEEYKTLHETIISGYEAQITALEQQNDLLDEQSQRQQKLIDISKAQQELENLRNEKSVRIYRADANGGKGGFVFESDPNKIRSATENLQKLQTDYIDWERDNDVKHKKEALQRQIKYEQDLIKTKEDNFNKFKLAFEDQWKDIETMSQNLLKTYGDNLDKAIAVLTARLATANSQLSALAGTGLTTSQQIPPNVQQYLDDPRVPEVAKESMRKQYGIVHDVGGELGDNGIAINKSGKPERILSPTQTEDFNTLVDHLPKAIELLNPEGMASRLLEYAKNAPNLLQNLNFVAPKFSFAGMGGSTGNSTVHNYNFNIDRIATQDVNSFINLTKRMVRSS